MNRLTQAFDKLRCDGYFAEEDFTCCQTCGWAAARDALEEDGKADEPERIVFYHGQDNDDLEETGQCYIAWNGDGQHICDVMAEFGIRTEWDGDRDTRILIDTRTN